MATTITGTTIDVGPNKLVANSAGNVGIGTSSPTRKLTVYDTDAYLALQNPTTGSAAGDGFQLQLVGNDVYHANYEAGSQIFTTSGSERMRINSAGIVTKPLQPAFLAQPSTTILNIPTGASGNLNFDAERFDTNSDYSSGTFTAPVTGKYFLTVNFYFINLDSAASYYEGLLTTSNRTYYTIVDPDFGQDNVYFCLVLTVLADMDAGDTANISVHQGGGSSQTDISASATFSGYLVA
mgnify:CR=1 FL=1